LNRSTRRRGVQAAVSNWPAGGNSARGQWAAVLGIGYGGGEGPALAVSATATATGGRHLSPAEAVAQVQDLEDAPGAWPTGQVPGHERRRGTLEPLAVAGEAGVPARRPGRAAARWRKRGGGISAARRSISSSGVSRSCVRRAHRRHRDSRHAANQRSTRACTCSSTAAQSSGVSAVSLSRRVEYPQTNDPCAVRPRGAHTMPAQIIDGAALSAQMRGALKERRGRPGASFKRLESARSSIAPWSRQTSRRSSRCKPRRARLFSSSSRCRPR
jgi:hypothetical protein